MADRKKKKGASQGLQLTQSQKLAAFLIVMGEDAAADIVKNFDDNERELVCAEMANLPLLDAADQGAVLQEFTTMAVEATSSVGGSVDYTRKVLEKSVGLFKAAEIIGRVGTARTSVATMQQIIDLDAVSICNLLREEDPQTIALVVSYLSAAKGSEVLMSLPDKVREVVIEKLATLESTPIEVVETLGEVLSAKVGKRVSRALNQTGGEKSAAAVLNAMHKDERKKLLDNMDEREIRQVVARISAWPVPRPKLEASGNMTLERVRGVAETGVDWISVGALTHSVRSVDLSLRLTGSPGHRLPREGASLDPS